MIIDVDMCDDSFNIGNVEVSLDSPLFVMAGPCVIESKAHCLEIASRLVDIGQRTGTGMIFKASFDKANRSSLQSFRGPGLEKGLEILAAVRRQTALAVMTDVHEPSQVDLVADVVDTCQGGGCRWCGRPLCRGSHRTGAGEIRCCVHHAAGLARGACDSLQRNI